jgi:hypothetical protein
LPARRRADDPAVAHDPDEFDGWHPRLKPFLQARFIAPAALLLAAVGIAWYVATPSVASYQASSLLILPLVVLALVQAHRRLPVKAQWVVAVAIAPVGPIGYAIAQNDQWWNWGQYSPLPLIVLTIARSITSRRDEGSGGYSDRGIGVSDGPWGPP